MSDNKVNPVYQDIEEGLQVPNNKITLAPKTDREYTYFLEDHIGDDRNIDAEIVGFVAKIQQFDSDAEVLAYVSANSDKFTDIAVKSLDLDHKDNKHVLKRLRFMDLFLGFMESIEFRTSGLHAPDVQEALKK